MNDSLGLRVRADFLENGDIVPLHYEKNGQTIRIDRILHFRNFIAESGDLLSEYLCRVGEKNIKLVYSKCKWQIND